MTPSILEQLIDIMSVFESEVESPLAPIVTPSRGLKTNLNQCVAVTSAGVVAGCRFTCGSFRFHEEFPLAVQMMQA